MKRIILFLLLSSFIQLTKAQQKPAYILYDSKGKKVSYGKMMKNLQKQDIILFGEFHDNPICHWLQLEVTKDCGEVRDLVLGAEMFEQDNQPAVDLYLAKKIDEKGLDSLARLWNNFKTDYEPLLNYARDHGLRFAASNVPRRYAALVFRGGFAALDTLSPKAKQWLAPLPIAYDSTLPGYVKMKEMMPGHGGDNLPRAQAIKDATMAHFILEYYKPGSLFLHFNGSYHSENREGILWYLQRQQPELRYATISTVSQKDIGQLEAINRGKADYIICVDADMTTTY